MNKETAFDIGLPRWSQLLLTGDPVTQEQAKNIIFATDPFFTSFGSGQGNNRSWESRMQKAMGMEWYHSDRWTRPFSSEDWRVYHALTDMWRHQGNSVPTEYVQNNWASSCFVGGPHGWCHPDGKLSYSDNIGKWPGVEDVYADFQAIAARYPFITAKATLMDGEGCESPISPLVTMLISGGEVTFLDLPPRDLGHIEIHGSLESKADVVSVFRHSMHDPLREQGLPDGWVLEMCARIAAFVDANLDNCRAALAREDQEGD